MQRIIAISNQKGGVGKSTTSLNLASGLANFGYKTLLIDLDPQCNLSKSLIKNLPKSSIYGVLLKELSLKESAVTINKNLLLIPSSKNLAAFENNSSGDIDSFFKLKEAIDHFTENISIDFIIIDCPPSLGIISTNAYVATTEVYVPLEAQEFSMDGLEQVIITIDKVKRRLNPNLNLKGVFFNKYHYRKNISKEFTNYLNTNFPQIKMSTYIRQCVKLEESPSAKMDIFSYAPESNGAKDYQKLIKEILNINNDDQTI